MPLVLLEAVLVSVNIVSGGVWVAVSIVSGGVWVAEVIRVIILEAVVVMRR